MKLDGDSLKQGLVSHIEKIGFAVALAMVGLFIYSGVQLEPYERSPSQLRSNAEQAQSRIASYKWEAIEAEMDPNRNFSEEVKESSKAIDSDGYDIGGQLDPTPEPDQIVPRADPEILPPVNLEVKAVFGPVAEYAQPNPFANLESAPKPEAEVIRIRRPTPKKSRSPRGMGGGSEMGMGMEMGMDGSEESGMDPSSAMGMGMEGGMDMGMEGGSGMPGTSRGRKLPNTPKHWVVPPGVGTQTMTVQPGSGGSKVGVVGRVVVAVMGEVEYEAQFDEFAAKLKEATGYQPRGRRDRPEYLSFLVQRAEVGDDPNAPLKWEDISNLPKAQRELMKFAGRGRELVDPEFCMPNLLTMETPPILIRDIDQFGLHSKFPMKHERGNAKTTQPVGPQAPEDPANPIVPGANPLIPGRGSAGSGMGMGMDPSGMGMDMGMDPSGEMGMGMGMDGGSGMGMDMEGGGMGPQSLIPMTKTKMIRYYDVTAQPNKKYRYRFQLVLSDPNNPQSGPLNPRILEPAVIDRVKQVKAESEAKGYQIYFRFSPWSDPSPVIETPSVSRLLAGPSEVLPKSKYFETPTGGIVHFAPPVSKAAAVVWGGRALPTDVSYSSDVSPGSVLNHDGDLKILTPDTHELKLAKGFSFQSDAVVVDMDHTLTIKDDPRDPKTPPQLTTSTIAMFDSEGNLVVADEVDDAAQFHLYAFVDDIPPPVYDDGSKSGSTFGDPSGAGGMDPFGGGDMFNEENE